MYPGYAWHKFVSGLRCKVLDLHRLGSLYSSHFKSKSSAALENGAVQLGSTA